jgi:hypothetical protein
VLLYRAVTYLPPIPLGVIACLTWQHAPALIHAKPADAGLAGEDASHQNQPGIVSRATMPATQVDDAE